ncbi:MAG: O-antigen ligase family protein [bacterium]
MNNQISNGTKNSILLFIVKAAVIASFFTPLFVSDAFIFPFVFPKTALFQVLVEIAFFAWLLLMFDRPEFRPRLSRLFWVVAVFMFIVFLSGVLGVDFFLSFWSSYERMTGFITMLHYFALFVILSSVFKTKKDWLMVFDFFIAAGLALCFIGLFQKLGVQGFFLAGVGRISATFGNGAYFAAYLLFLLFFIVFMYFQRRRNLARIYYAAAFLFAFVILFWTQTRGGLLAFGASLILFLVAMIFWPRSVEETPAFATIRKKLKRISAVILICFVLFSASVFVFKNSGWVRNSYTLRRLANISASETTSQTRLLAWGMSWEGVKERPILGWGWENYNVVFNKFYDPQLYPVENWFDRAHNIVFDTLVTTGFLGFLSFLSIFGLVLVIIWRAYKQKRIDFLNAALFAILPLGYLAQDFFVFDMIYSYLPLFTFLAFIDWIGKSEKRAVATPHPIRPNVFLQVAVAVVLIFFGYFLNIKPALAGIWGIKALAAQQESLQAVDANFRKALSYGTFGRFEVRLQLFDIAKNLMTSYDKYQNKGPVDDFVRLALEEGDKNIKERPQDARYAVSIGELNLAAVPMDASRLVRAEEIFSDTLKLSPTKELLYFGLGETKLRLGKIDEGLELFKKAIALNDKILDPHWNLALMYFAIGRIQDGEAKLADIQQRFGPDALTASNYLRLGMILRNNNDLGRSISCLLKGLQLSPQNADIYAALADSYLADGQRDKAKEAALKVVEIDPSQKDYVDQFLKASGL